MSKEKFDDEYASVFLGKIGLCFSIVVCCSTTMRYAKCFLRRNYEFARVDKMERIVIKGGRKLKGTIRISGAKNAALPIIAASLLTKKEVVLHGVPNVRDVHMMAELVRSTGAKLGFENDVIRIQAVKVRGEFLSDNMLASEIRSVNGLLGALLHRLKRIKVPLPGGDRIGTRKLDTHISTLTELGAEVNIKKTHIITKSNKLYGCRLVLPYPSVGVTENAMIAASLAEGASTIENAAKEPEIVDLANFLNLMGTEIRGAGTSVIKINGVEELSGTDYTVIPDRIETGTYMVAAAITNGDVLLKNADLGLLERVVSMLNEVGVEVQELSEGVHITSSGRFNPVNIITEPYPGFPTDMQPIITPLLSIADGKSSIKETIFDCRFNHVPELMKMGANIRVNGDMAVIEGPTQLKGAKVKALDLRAGGSLMLAGLIAKGETAIEGVHQIFRGYEDPLIKLKNVGANCTLIAR